MKRIDEITEFFRLLASPLCLYARQWLDSNQAEEAVQEAFVRLLGQNVLPTEIKSWLYRTVRNECLSRLRRKRVNHNAVTNLKTGQQSWFEPAVDDQLDAQLLQKKLEQLPVADREVVTLRLWGQMNFREIAELTGQPLSTVHRSYQNTLEILRKQMEIQPCNRSVNLKVR